MATCDCCGNSYSKPISVTMEGKKYEFDCFECAIHTLAPACTHCGCKIIGHGVEVNDEYFCCEHCAEHHKQMAKA